jgi:hypothetical protein
MGLHAHSALGVALTDDRGLALVAFGTTVPTDATPGYAIGCLFIHTDGAAGSALYCNEGTEGSCNFDLVTVA